MSETKSDSMWIMLCDIRDYLKEDVTSQLKVLENRQISFNEWFHREWVALKKQKPELHDQSDDLLSFSIRLEAMQKDIALFNKEVTDLKSRISLLERANIKRIEHANGLDDRIVNLVCGVNELNSRIHALEQKQNRGFFARIFNLGS